MLFVLLSRNYVTAWLLRNTASVPAEWLTSVDAGKFDHLAAVDSAPDQEALEDKLEGLLKQQQLRQERAAAKVSGADDPQSDDNSSPETATTLTQRQRQRQQREQELTQRKRAVAEAAAAKEAADRSRDAVLKARRADRYAIERFEANVAAKRALDRGGWSIGARLVLLRFADELPEDKQLTELFVVLRDDVATKPSAFVYVFCDWSAIGRVMEIASSAEWSVSPVPLLIQFMSPLSAVRARERESLFYVLSGVLDG